VTGLNNNEYQLERAAVHAARENIADKWSSIKGDFMKMDIPDNTFDGVSALEEGNKQVVMNRSTIVANQL
jgi:sterol 24-C-methyltransferase